jgi:nicotinate phosphoribosyltransferase
MKQIITSIIDNDLYKLTMLNAVLKLYPNEKVEYKFHNRGNTKFPKGFAFEIEKQFFMMKDLSLTQTEELYLRKKLGPQFGEEFYEFIREFRFNADYLFVTEGIDGSFSLTIKGLWQNTILWEVPLMAMISEMYYIMSNITPDFEAFKKKTFDKGSQIFFNNLNVNEFGTRRRFSKLTQSIAIRTLKMSSKGRLLGTSNLYFGMIHELVVSGTQAHEWTMFHATKHHYINANLRAVEAWMSVYGDSYSTLLPDTYTSRVFFDSLPNNIMEKCNGFRQDSGNPYAFTDLVLIHCEELGAYSEFKTITYSDNLNMDKILLINEHRKDKIKKAYGVGTNFTNDFEGVAPLNMVIKLDKVNNKSTVKLSDDSGKYTGDSNEILKCKEELNL